MRQLSTRDGASLFSTHPPTGLRARMLLSRMPVQGTLVLDANRSAAIDAELARPYRYLVYQR